MCLSTCQNIGDPCPVNDPNTQFSICALQMGGSQQKYCAWICELQGKTFSCPNSVDYTCQAINMSSVKLCVPK